MCVVPDLVEQRVAQSEGSRDEAVARDGLAHAHAPHARTGRPTCEGAPANVKTRVPAPAPHPVRPTEATPGVSERTLSPSVPRAGARTPDMYAPAPRTPDGTPDVYPWVTVDADGGRDILVNDGMTAPMVTPTPRTLVHVRTLEGTHPV